MMFDPDRDAEFREATSSRLPTEDVGAAFLEEFRKLGYAMGSDREATQRDESSREESNR